MRDPFDHNWILHSQRMAYVQGMSHVDSRSVTVTHTRGVAVTYVCVRCRHLWEVTDPDDLSSLNECPEAVVSHIMEM